MIEKEIQFRKKREIGEIITDSFEFIKQEHKPVLRLVFIYVLPFAILYGIVAVNVQMKILGSVDFSDPESFMANMGPMYTNLLVSSLFMLFVQSLLAGTYYSYIEMYVKKGKGNFELSEITPSLFSNGLIALGANLVLFIIVVIGTMMCLVPGIYFANTLSLVVMLSVFEKKGLTHALTKSWNLVNSQWWNTFLLNIVGFVILWAISFVLSIPSMLTGVGSSLFSAKESGVLEQSDSYWILVGISTVVSALFWIIPYTFMAMQYFNLDERTKADFPDRNSIE